jgi:peroxiredoxin
MRKKIGLIVFLFGILMSQSAALSAVKKEMVKIYGSLEEAVGRPHRPLLLVFFSLECRVCWDELFEMRYFLEKNDIPVDLVGISPEPEEELRPFLAKYGFFHPVVSDRRKAVFRKFQVRQEPFRIILDREAVVFMDDTSVDFFVRRDKVEKCLLEIASR